MSIDALLILVIFVIAFVLILGEYVHRTLAAWGGALTMLIVGYSYGSLSWCSGHLFGFKENKEIEGPYYAIKHECENNLFTAIDFNVIGLLMGMMIFAAMLEICGFFEFVAIKATKLSKGDPWMLVVYLGTFTTLISIVIDNVTAIILIAPITIKICDKIKISAIPPLIAEAILSDTGGVATLVGDPPNVMIASFTADTGTAFTFNSFIEHLTPLTFFAWVVTLGYMRYYYKDWRETKPENVKEILNEDEWAAIKDNGMLNKTLLTLAGTIILFSLHELVLSPRGIHIEISAIALGGAGIAMMLSLPDVHHVIEKVEWTALLFFAGLFTMVGALEHMGHLENIAKWIFAKFGPDGSISNEAVILAVVMIWVAAVASAVVDNIPFCAAMLPIIHNLGEMSIDPETGMAAVNVVPLYWALAMGCGFGGNATPIGSSANVMTVSISERGGHKITTKEWMRVGLPVMLITCVVATIFMYLFYDTLYVYP